MTLTIIEWLIAERYRKSLKQKEIFEQLKLDYKTLYHWFHNLN